MKGSLCKLKLIKGKFSSVDEDNESSLADDEGKRSQPSLRPLAEAGGGGGERVGVGPERERAAGKVKII